MYSILRERWPLSSFFIFLRACKWADVSAAARKSCSGCNAVVVGRVENAMRCQ